MDVAVRHRLHLRVVACGHVFDVVTHALENLARNGRADVLAGPLVHREPHRFVRLGHALRSCLPGSARKQDADGEDRKLAHCMHVVPPNVLCRQPLSGMPDGTLRKACPFRERFCEPLRFAGGAGEDMRTGSACAREGNMTGENVVERLRAYAVAPAGMPGVRFHGRMAPEAMTVELVRLTFANGAEGVASSMSGSTKGEGEHVVTTLARLAERVVGADGSPDSPLTGELIEEAGEGPWPAISIVDCALWDARARDAGQPLWRLLGGRRDRLPAYASTPAWLSVDAYLDEVRRLAAAGYRAIKFHMNTDPEFDLEMVRAVAGAWADSGLRFMADMEQLCTFDEAVRLGETLSGLPFDWLEAPLPDTDLDAYAELNRAVGIDVLAAGNTLVGMENWKDGPGAQGVVPAALRRQQRRRHHRRHRGLETCTGHGRAPSSSSHTDSSRHSAPTCRSCWACRGAPGSSNRCRANPSTTAP